MMASTSGGNLHYTKGYDVRALMFGRGVSAICARNQYTCDPVPVIDELVRAAAGRDDLLASVAGTWVGYFGSPETTALAKALRALPGAESWIAEGWRRRGMPTHGAPTDASFHL